MLQRGHSLAMDWGAHVHAHGGGGGGAAGPAPEVKQLNNYLGIGVDAKASRLCLHACRLGCWWRARAPRMRAPPRRMHRSSGTVHPVPQVALEFHHFRDKHPYFFTSQLGNKFWHVAGQQFGV